MTEKKEEEVQTKEYQREAGVELQGMWRIMQKGERKGDAAGKEGKAGSTNESSGLGKGGLSQGVGRKKREEIRKKVHSGQLAL